MSGRDNVQESVTGQSSALVGPDSLEISSRKIRTGETWCETLVVTGYPRNVTPGWLTPLLCHRGPVDVALHIQPLPNDLAAQRLKRQLARLESTRRIEASKDRLADPELEAAAVDAADLMAALARAEGRLFRVGLYLTVRASSEGHLEAEVQKVLAVCASLLLDARRTTFRSLDAWTSTLPLATDRVGLSRTFDTKALAACFPFTGSSMEEPAGIFLGRNPNSGGLLFLDRFALENHNQVILAHSGKGKSYVAKLQIMRSLYQDIQVLVVDPENEYERLAEAVGGSVIRLGPGGHRLNPLDLAAAGEAEALVKQAIFVHTVVSALLGGISEQGKCALDRAVLGAYEAAGITSDPATHGRPAPLMGAVVELLEKVDGRSLADRLRIFTEGSHRGLLDEPTSVRPEGHLVVFAMRDVPAELKPTATLLALDAIWRRVIQGSRMPRIVVVDEAWLLVQSEAGARFLHRLAKSARKHWCGLTVITQDVGDVLSTPLGQAVVTNAACHVLLGQHTQALRPLARAFHLSERERGYLLSCPPGRGLLCAGNERAALQVVASPVEHRVATSNPGELAAIQAEGRA